MTVPDRHAGGRPDPGLPAPDNPGPLRGVRVVEIASLAPGPFAGFLLADMGADVVRVDRKEAVGVDTGALLLGRGRRSLAADLKHPEGVDTVLRLVERADILIAGGRNMYTALKARIPFLDINQEREFGYAGYAGMAELARQLALTIENPIWPALRKPAPWEEVAS